MCQSLVYSCWLNIKLKEIELNKNYKTQEYAVYKIHTSNITTQRLKQKDRKRYTMQLLTMEAHVAML